MEIVAAVPSPACILSCLQVLRDPSRALALPFIRILLVRGRLWEMSKRCKFERRKGKVQIFSLFPPWQALERIMKQEMLWKLRVVRLVWLRRCTGALLFQTDGCAFVSLWASGAYRDRRTLEMCLILQLIIKSCSYTNKPRCFFLLNQHVFMLYRTSKSCKIVFAAKTLELVCLQIGF